MSSSHHCNADDAEKGMGSGVLGAVGRVYRRSSAAVASAVLGSPPSLAGVAGEGGEGENGDPRSQRQEKRWQSFLSRRESVKYGDEGNGGYGEERVGLTDDASASVGEEEGFDRRTRRSEGRPRRGLHGDGGGDNVDSHDGRQSHAEGPLQSRSPRDTTKSRRKGADEVRKTTPAQFNLHREKGAFDKFDARVDTLGACMYIHTYIC